MNKTITAVFICALITLTTGIAGGDYKKRHHLQSVYDCEMVNCTKAYMKFIKENNPYIDSKDAKEILSAVKYYTPRYFGEEPEVGADMTLAIMAVESSMQPGVMGDNGMSYKLMQIQQETAKDAAKYNGIKREYDLTKTWDNIHLGMANLNFLHERYEGYWMHAVIAYNMGPGAVDYLIKKYDIINDRTYWNKVKTKKNRLDWIKKEIHDNT